MNLAVIDYVVIAILGIFAIIGFVKGFLNTLVSLFGNLASLAIAIILAKSVANFLNNTFTLVEKLGNWILTGIVHLLPEFIPSESMTGQQIIDSLGAHGLLGKIIGLFVDSSVTYVDLEHLESTLSVSLGNAVLIVFTVIALFILIRIALALLSKLFDAITKNRALSGLDRIMGFVFGLAKGILFVGVILGALYVLNVLPFIGSWFNGLVEESVVVKWMYEYLRQFFNWVIDSVDWGALAGGIM